MAEQVPSWPDKKKDQKALLRSRGIGLDHKRPWPYKWAQHEKGGDYDIYTVDKLKEMLGDRGLDVLGKKSVLIERLQADDNREGGVGSNGNNDSTPIGDKDQTVENEKEPEAVGKDKAYGNQEYGGNNDRDKAKTDDAQNDEPVAAEPESPTQQEETAAFHTFKNQRDESIKVNYHQETGEEKVLHDRFDFVKELLGKHTCDGARLALDEINWVLQHSPNWDDAILLGHLARATCLFFDGSMNEAMKHLKHILKNDPDNAKAVQLVKSIRLVRQERIENSEKQKQQADDARNDHNYTLALELYGKALEGLEACPSSEKIDSLKVILYCSRAACHTDLGQHAESIAECNKALQVNPRHFKARSQRLASNLQIGGIVELEDAFADYAELRKLASSDNERRLLSDLEAALGNYNLYKLLGINRDATQGQIRGAYRRLALKHHPDKRSINDQPRANSMFSKIFEAYKKLRDMNPIERRQYNQEL
jgi:tetratricopeptide (TPR) repeat protein